MALNLVANYTDSEDEEAQDLPNGNEDRYKEQSDKDFTTVKTSVTAPPQRESASPNTQTQCNFFGFDNGSDTDNSDTETYSKSKTLNKKTSLTQSLQSQIEVVLPKSNFWQKRDSPEKWDQPEKIWQHKSTESFSEKIRRLKRPVASVGNNKSNEEQLVSYVNKRTKNTQSQDEHTEQATPLTKKCYFVHHKVQPYLHRNPVCTIPPTRSKSLCGHLRAVNRVVWNTSEFSHLLLSVSMDRTVKIWNAFSSFPHPVQEFSHHTKAVKDGLWTSQGKQVLTCGYDNSTRLFDIEKGTEVLEFKHQDFLTCIVGHPSNPNYFMCGSLNRIICWDQRSNSRPVKQLSYKESFGQVQNIQFVNDGREFFTCNDIVSRDSSDKNVMVWDFLAGAVLSNQVYQERYTCTRLKAYPSGGEILAQTNGDYIASFSTVRPYKMNKCKRFESHKVQGYNIGCDTSPDGQYVISGSSDCQLFVYDYRTARVLRTLNCDGQVCMDVAWHPHLPGTVAASTWGGDIKIWS